MPSNIPSSGYLSIFLLGFYGAGRGKSGQIFA